LRNYGIDYSGTGVLVLCSIVVLLVASPLADGRSPPLPSASQTQAYKKPIQTQRPFNIAHRGANGEIPEETFAAYQRAIEVGADFIETDILATKDGKLICFHDVTLDALTDVANFSQFADRNRTYLVQGVNTTGFFTVDFTLEEIQTLRVNQRFPDRDPSYNGMSIPLQFLSPSLEAVTSVQHESYRISCFEWAFV
jgi:glycerophosphoryl diester phosphodiesterase